MIVRGMIDLPNARPWLPRTGQTTVYRTGDDGTFQAGRPGTTRFVDNGNGTVFDRHTGLTWIKQPELIIPGATGVHATNQIQVARGDWANDTVYAAADLAKDTVGSTFWVCAVPHTSAAAGTFAADRAANPTYWRATVWTASAADLLTPATMTWNNAIDNCLGTRWGGAFSYAGFADWRLPNWSELVSPFDASLVAAPPVSPTFFPNVKLTAEYWSSTTRSSAATYALTPFFGYAGYVATTVTLKTVVRYCRPVRGGRTILG
jgi:hypothetical protein